MKKLKKLFLKEDKGLFNFFLVVVLLIAFLLRFPGIFSGLLGETKLYTNVDETGILSRAFNIIRTADYNPHDFNYPSLLIYLEVIFQTAVYLVSVGANFYIREFENTVFPAAHFFAIGRLLIVLLGTVSVWVLYRLTEKITNRRIAILSAGILAVTFAHVWDSQYATTDTLVTFLGLVSVYYSLEVLKEGKWKSYLAGAAFVGLAIGAKYNAFTFVTPLITAHFIRTWRIYRQLMPFKFWEKFFNVIFLTSMVIIPIVYLLTTPYTFLDLKKFIQDYTAVIASTNRGLVIHLTNANGISSWLWYIYYSATSGLYYPEFAAVILGMIWGIIRFNSEKIVLWSYILLNYILIGLAPGRMDRWIIPMYPYLIIFAAFFLYDSGRFLLKKRPLYIKYFSWFSYLLVLLSIFGLGIYRAIVYNWSILQPDTRLRASYWIAENISHSRYIFAVDSAFSDAPLKKAGFTNLRGGTVLGDRALAEIMATKEDRYIVFQSGHINTLKNYRNSEKRLLPYYDSQSSKELYNNFITLTKQAKLIKEIADPYVKSGFYGPGFLEQSSTVSFWRNPTVLIYYLPAKKN